MEEKAAPRIIRKKEVLQMVALSDPTIWRAERAGTFPKRLQLGGNSVGWLASEILEWIQERAEARGA